MGQKGKIKGNVRESKQRYICMCKQLFARKHERIFYISFTQYEVFSCFVPFKQSKAAYF